MRQKDQIQDQEWSYLAQLIQETSPEAFATGKDTQYGPGSQISKPKPSSNVHSTARPEEEWNVDTVRVPRLRRPARLQPMPTSEPPTSSATEAASLSVNQARTPLSPIGLGHLEDLSDIASFNDDDETLHAVETVRRIHQRYMLRAQAQGQLKAGNARGASSGRLGSNQASAAHLMQLSGMMRAVRVSEEASGTAVEPNDHILELEEFWPEGIKQTGPLSVSNLYGREPFGRTLPGIPAVPTTPAASVESSAEITTARPWWRTALSIPAVRVGLGLLIGIGLLLLVARYVDIPTTIRILHTRLTTPQGILYALLCGVAFLLAFCIRGVRWKLFLNPIGRVSTFKVIQLFLIGTFLNFLLPIRGGEVAKSLMLKRIADIPVSQSLPTVAMDKALDLMPALVIMAIVPFLGLKMDMRLWLVLGTVGALLVCLVFFIALAAWKRDAAITLLQRMTRVLPMGLGRKIEGFATGFVDALLAGASQPRIFIPAVLLTIVAVIFDGLSATLAFWTVGVPVSFGIAIFGYAIFNMFFILPTPPGQVGSNEFFGLLVFTGLLHLDPHGVTAMFIFSHPWTAIIQAVVGLICLSALGLTVSSAMKVQSEV
jgi:uncharacterized protein (TIRG00374 family)